MRTWRVTLKSGEVHQFQSPFTAEALRRSMGLPDSATIEPLEENHHADHDATSTLRAAEAPR